MTYGISPIVDLKILNGRILDMYVPEHRRRSDHNDSSAVDVRPPKTDMFVDAMTNMQQAAQKAALAMSALATSAAEQGAELTFQMAFQRAVMRDCALTPEERAAQEDALWECQALAIRLAPVVFEKTYTMYGTMTLAVEHGLFTRDVLVQVFACTPRGDDGDEFPQKSFQWITLGVNTVSIQLVGAEFRKPPFQIHTTSQRQTPPSRIRVRVSA